MNQQIIDNNILAELFSIKEAIHHLSQFPIKHENVLTYISSRYHGNNRKMNLLKNRVRGDIMTLDWLEKWYPESDLLISEKYREQTIENIQHQLSPMNATEVKEMHSWNMSEMLSSDNYRLLHNDLIKEIS